MSRTLPNVEIRSTLQAGDCLFTTNAIAAGVEIFRIDKPLVAVLDSPHLQDTCANCLHIPSDTANSEVQAHGPGDVSLGKLKNCLGCRIVRYCSKPCQEADWKSGHRFECKIFQALHPNVLPNTVRLVLRLILCRQGHYISDGAWKAWLDLQSHIDAFKSASNKNEDGLTTWQTIELMSQAVTKYSGTTESAQNVQAMLARVMINTHSLTTQTLDPLGICLEPRTALLNHSCTPNSHLLFDGSKLALRSLTAIPSGLEVTIAYSDTTVSTVNRRADLQSRYFFTCGCPACSQGTTNGRPDPQPDTHIDGVTSQVYDIQAKADSFPPQKAQRHWRQALSLLKDCPPYQQPHASILHFAFLNAIACQGWALALRRALIAYFYVEPVQYPVTWHPIRIVRKWVLLRLVMQVAMLFQEEDENVKVLIRHNVDWHLVAVGLWAEVDDGVGMSHGRESSFAKEVRVFGQGIGVADSDLGEGRIKVQLPRVEIEKQWVKLRGLADSDAWLSPKEREQVTL